MANRRLSFAHDRSLPCQEFPDITPLSANTQKRFFMTLNPSCRLARFRFFGMEA
jgi:hypothetical protein